jgi:CheY-like chemotaxis protein
MRVLVADDDPDMRESVADALERLGHDIVPAENGARLVEELASEGPFDLIVSDISMPWLDGLKTLRSLRTSGVSTPIIVMTALTDRQIPALVRALGPHVILLSKPFELDELAAAVQSLVAVPSADREI